MYDGLKARVHKGNYRLWIDPSRVIHQRVYFTARIQRTAIQRQDESRLVPAPQRLSERIAGEAARARILSDADQTFGEFACGTVF